MNRRTFLAGTAAVLLAAPLAAEAPQAKRVWRLGVLDPGFSQTEDTWQRSALVLRLRDLGYVEHQNLAVERRYAEGRIDRLPGLAAELVQLKVNRRRCWGGRMR
jgi:putative ABC transport system substrate-binding protein